MFFSLTPFYLRPPNPPPQFLSLGRNQFPVHTLDIFFSPGFTSRTPSNPFLTETTFQMTDGRLPSLFLPSDQGTARGLKRCVIQF